MRVASLILLSSIILTVAVTTAHADGRAVRDVLLDQAGPDDPVLVVADGKGILARTASGKQLKRLVAGKVTRVALDAPMDLIWFVRAGTLFVLDLREVKPRPVAVARNLGALSYSVKHADGRYAGTYDRRDPAFVEINLVAQTIDVATQRAALPPRKGMALIRSAWLVDVAGRMSRPQPGTGAVVIPTGPAIAIPQSVSTCPAGDPKSFGLHCGDHQALPVDPPRRLVITTLQRLPDEQVVGCHVYDEATGGFTGVPPDAGARASGACGPFVFDATGRYFLAAQSVCRLDLTCTRLRATPAGWLDQGATIEIE